MNVASCYSCLKPASYLKSRTAAITDESKNIVEKSCLEISNALFISTFLPNKSL